MFVQISYLLFWQKNCLPEWTHSLPRKTRLQEFPKTFLSSWTKFTFTFCSFTFLSSWTKNTWNKWLSHVDMLGLNSQKWGNLIIFQELYIGLSDFKVLAYSIAPVLLSKYLYISLKNKTMCHHITLLPRQRTMKK